MEIKKAMRAFNAQKGNAKSRGIEFNLTFKQWCDFWGEDIDLRGRGPNNLQMQRFADTGPYEIGNIRKGVPRQNSATYSRMCQKRKTDKAHGDLQARLNAAMCEESGPDREYCLDDDAYKLGIHSSYDMRYSPR